jgi:hypothetical protein
VPGTGGPGLARLEALTVIAAALGCQATGRDLLTGHRHRSVHGGYYLTGGGRPVRRLAAARLPRR